MKNRSVLTILNGFVLLALFYPKVIFALPSCGNYFFSQSALQLNFSIPDSNLFVLDPNKSYTFIKSEGNNIVFNFTPPAQIAINKQNGTIVINGDPDAISSEFMKRVFLDMLAVPGTNTFKIIDDRGFGVKEMCEGRIKVDLDGDQNCNLSVENTPPNGFFNVGDTVQLNGRLNQFINRPLTILVKDSSGEVRHESCKTDTDLNGNFKSSLIIDSGSVGKWNIEIYPEDISVPTTCSKATQRSICSQGFFVGTLSQGGSFTNTKICNFIEDNTNSQKCVDCFAKPGVYTPFGCVETNPQEFVGKILQIAISIAGGIAFLMIVYGGIVIMTSSGNPEKLTSGKEIITSAVTGLLLIIFSVVILKIVGVDILGIPGLGG